MITVSVPALLGWQRIEHPDAVRAEDGESGRLRLYATPAEGESQGTLVAQYAVGRWLDWRLEPTELVKRADLDHLVEVSQARIAELHAELDQYRAAAIDTASEPEFDAFLDATGAAGQAGEQYLAHVDDRLLWLLNVAGREWGPMGVALAAARMSDPQAVRRALKAPRS